MKSDLSLDIGPFQPENIDPSTSELNKALVKLCKADVKWWQCGAAEYRRRRVAGETPFPQAPKVDNTSDILVPSPEGHEIHCRVFGHDHPNPKGVFYHIHGGGYVLGSSAGQDLLLSAVSQATNLVIVSIDYRLAPEHPFPVGLDDCRTVADWLIENSREKWHCDFRFIGGESAGATLSASVLLYLREASRLDNIAGAVLNYGNYDLSILPSMTTLDPENSALLTYEDCKQFSNAYLPTIGRTERKSPAMSPVYNKLDGLTSALFVVGTEDGCLDDTLLMATKWQIAGNEAIVKFIPGACHGFMTFDGSKVKITRQGWDAVIQYLNEKC
ncbi:uncharacterized protein N7479_003999 [Penicillium vulpinum]|uniref:Alpha/beta hydrolase fold-3 domain-containing protein n=1 Tax=Penicillium vulpinum TaxID=29845 RepID=A0A1V6SCY3_9EURO|nr:uncharacterized protein N7479_003999 [Penicillium vulpinum]KAJ5964123.1 hypothetical protein N7479_003999 [Penicillium vulpinum]OQE11564.1 hypothetical protein PENVUL_c002G05275 [Penicillium vulpinum]